METLIRNTVKEEGSKEVKKLKRTIHHLSAQNDLLHYEIKGVKNALLTKKKQEKKSYTLDLQQREEEYHEGAVFWSPRKVREARHRETVKEREKDELQLQKVQRAELKEQARLYKLQVDEEKRVEREAAKAAREKEKADKAAERDRKNAARDAEKAIQQSQKGKRKASQASTQANKRRDRGVAGAAAVVEDAGGAPAPPPITTRRGRNVTFPSKYK
jgi:hypothetical protein